MTAASILATPMPVAAPFGATKAAAPGMGDVGMDFADMVAAEAPSDVTVAPAKDVSAPPIRATKAAAPDAGNASMEFADMGAAASSSVVALTDAIAVTPSKDVSAAVPPVPAPPATQLVFTLSPVAKPDVSNASAEIPAPLVVPTPLVPTEDGLDASTADSEVADAPPTLKATPDSPADPSAAMLALLIAPAPTPQPIPQTATNNALVSAAAAEIGALQAERTPTVEDDAANTDAEVEAAARQAAAAQTLAAALPAPKALLRPLDAAPLKDAPANASASTPAEASETSPSSDTSESAAQPAPAAATPNQTTPPTAAPSQHAALAPIPTAETPLQSAAPTDLAAAAPAPAASSSAPSVPVIVTNASNLSQVTVETTVQIAAQITRKLEGRSTRFEMAMTPEGLGRVDISLDIDSGGKLTARLAFDNPLAATEMRGKADELRRELQNAGFTIANDGLDFSQRQPSPDGGFDRRQGRAFAGASRINADADLTQPAPAAWVSLSLTPRGVDMKV